MKTEQLTLNQIKSRGYAALMKELGPVDFVRFIQEFEPGQGDYTQERHQWLDSIDFNSLRPKAARRPRK